VLGSDAVDHSAGRLLEALLDLHANTAVDLAHFPEVDAFARLVAPTDFECCTKSSAETVALRVIAGSADAGQMCPCGCGATAERAAELNAHMGYL
jgi:hypothetical protein